MVGEERGSAAFKRYRGLPLIANGWSSGCRLADSQCSTMWFTFYPFSIYSWAIRFADEPFRIRIRTGISIRVDLFFRSLVEPFLLAKNCRSSCAFIRLLLCAIRQPINRSTSKDTLSNLAYDSSGKNYGSSNYQNCSEIGTGEFFFRSLHQNRSKHETKRSGM